MEKKDIIGINYQNLREIFTVKPIGPEISSLVELAILKFCAWIAEIDRKNLHWMMYGQLPQVFLDQIGRVQKLIKEKGSWDINGWIWQYGIQLLWKVDSQEIVPQEYFAIEKGWVQGWYQKTKKEVARIRNKEFKEAIQEKERKRQRRTKFDQEIDRTSKRELVVPEKRFL